MPFPRRLARLRPLGRNRSKLPFPVVAHLRIAQISPCAAFESAEHFAFEGWHGIEVFQPQVLLGSPLALQMLAVRAQEKSLDLSCVDHAVFATSECGEPPLTDAARVVLWQTFGVPVYELFLDAAGELLASECEMHDGWHLEPHVKLAAAGPDMLLLRSGKSQPPMRLAARVETAVCPCGRTGLRLLPSAQKPPAVPGRILAATA